MSTSRRQFIAGLGAASVASLRVVAPATAAPDHPALLRPPALRPGDTVGLVNPATAAFETMPIEIARESLEALGLRVRLGPSYWQRRGYFAGADADRARDLNNFFADPEIAGLVARGGWGSARVLPHLDYEAIRRRPKVLLGYSDVTALLLGIHARTGLVTFHGPFPRHRVSAEHLRRVAFAGEAPLLENLRTIAAHETVATEHRTQTITPGQASGPLLGGNLTVLSSLVGSGYLPEFDGCILFLEDINEAVYRIDRMLTQLALAGILARIAGFVFGNCTDCDPDNSYGSLTLEEVLRDHIDQQFTLPLGVLAQLDADAGTLQLLEPAVAVR